MRSLFFATLLLAGPASAAEPDPRVVGPLVQFLQANISLDEALIKALREDAQKREAEWAEYSKPLWQPPAAVSEAK